MKSLDKKLKNLGDMSIKRPMDKAIAFVQSDAKQRCPVKDGELRGSIYTDTEVAKDRCVGTCYTNKEYAAYVEFGTGPKGQMDHNGISPEVAIAYSQKGWWIHESDIDAATAEMYHFQKIVTEAGIFYYSTGQAAQPFMYPALADNEEVIERIFAKEIRKEIGGIHD
jgi:HK97 gp10 family phage protein